MDIAQIPLLLIDIGNDRARSFSPETANILAGTIRVQGLHHPIRVRPVGDRYVLISGRHRLEAFRINEAATIPATVSDADSPEAAQLEEVMENLARGELIALDRCHHLYDMKQAWERLHPETKNGGNRGNQHTGGRSRKPASGEEAPIMGFAQTAAEKLGLGITQIKLAVQIWTEIVPTVRAKLIGTDLARKMTELKALSELTAPRQVKVIDLIQSEDHPEIKNIAEALAFLEGGIQPTPLEKRYRVLSEGLKLLSPQAFDRLLAEYEDRIVESLKRRGVI